MSASVNLVFFLLSALFASSISRGGPVSYEGDVFPENDGWARVYGGQFAAHRTLGNGILTQFVDAGTGDSYRRPIIGVDSEEPFFVEWRLETDVPRSVLDYTATPVVMSVYGNGPYYHVVITDSEVVLSRSNFLPYVFVDITPGMFHTYRLELDGAVSYSFSIDGEVIDSGVPTSSLLDRDPGIIWGDQRMYFDHTSQWDYVRYWSVPEPATGLLLLTGCAALLRRKR